MISGRKTFSSKLPCAPPMLIATSLPNTWQQTIVIASRLRRVHLARHDRAARLVLRESRARRCRCAGPLASQRTSLAIFMSDAASVFSAPCACTSAVVRGQRLELVGRRDERQRPSACASSRRDARAELRMRVQPGADRGAAERQLAQVRQRCVDVREAVVELRHVAGELLAQRERRRVLQVRAPDLDDVGERRRLRVQRVAQRLQGRQRASRSIASAAATCIAVGNTSLEDCPRFTSSFGCTRRAAPRAPPSSSLARFASTSFTFMLVWVPEPVCHTDQRKLLVEGAVHHFLRRRARSLRPCPGQAPRAPR